MNSKVWIVMNKDILYGYNFTGFFCLFVGFFSFVFGFFAQMKRNQMAWLQKP